MKLEQLVIHKDFMESLIGKTVDGKTALEIAKFVCEAYLAIRDFEKKRIEYFKKYGEEVDGKFQIKPENEKKFKAAITRRLNKEIDLEPLDMSELDLSLTPGELINNLSLFK